MGCQRLPMQFGLSGLAIRNQQSSGHQTSSGGAIRPHRKHLRVCSRATQLAEEILSHVTHNLVAVYTGLAAIVGDMNADPLDLPQMRVWESFGWVNAQSLARDRWQQSPMPTCKGKTERDQIWLSPQLAALCNQVQVLPTLRTMPRSKWVSPTFRGPGLPPFHGNRSMLPHGKHNHLHCIPTHKQTLQARQAPSRQLSKLLSTVTDSNSHHAL